MKKIAVIGSGVMGAGIAAQCANAGLQVVLLDIPDHDADDRSSISRQAIQRQLQVGGFMSPELAKRIEVGNLADDLDLLADVDWIIEAVIEDLHIKRDLYQRINNIRKADTIVSSNTSTIPLQHLIEDLPTSFKQHFVVTHFFNPPRQMRLLELVSGPVTAPKVLARIEQCCDQILGKSVVYGKDAPGFIANRIGLYWMMIGVHTALAMNIDITEADALLSKPAGIPKTGIFGLWDLVGIDLWPKLAESLVALLPAQDAYHAVTTMPELVKNMIADGYTGRKGKGGFYRLFEADGKRVKQCLNLSTGHYENIKPLSTESLDLSKQALKTMLAQPNLGSRYSWRVFSKTLNYAASHVAEIADSYQAVDEAMRTGYAWRMGPFQLIDQIGPAWFVQQLQHDKQPVAEVLQQIGDRHFYQKADDALQVRTFDGDYQKLARAPGVLLLEDIKHRSNALSANAVASLWDIGDGVTCLELHSKMNALQPESFAMMEQALAVTRREHRAMIIYNEGPAFSAGANLALLRQWLQDGATETVRAFIQQGQHTYTALKSAPFPVVAATAGVALGGGCEMALHCDAIWAHAETRIGLVETSVGLIPAWGGCKEMLLRHGGDMHKALPPIATASMSSSAINARAIGILSERDGITMNRHRLLADAKAKAIALSANYRAPVPKTIPLHNNTAFRAWFEEGTDKGVLAKHDRHICEALADAFVDGERVETDLFIDEITVFIRLTTTPETLARIEHLLDTGKPLRN